MSLGANLKQSFLIFLVSGLFVALCSDNAAAQFWKRKKDEKKTSPQAERQTSGGSAQPANLTVDTEPPVVNVPTVPKIPPLVTKTAGATGVPKIPDIEPPVDLDTIQLTQRELGVLAERYEELRRVHQEQLISLRVLASQAKIHAQLLDGLKANLSVRPASSPAASAALDASSLEKYRLIRDRMKTQQKFVEDITEGQRRLRDALSVANIPTLPAPPKVSINANTVPSSLALVKQVNELKTTQSVLENARAEQEKAKGEAEKKENQ